MEEFNEIQKDLANGGYIKTMNAPDEDHTTQAIQDLLDEIHKIKAEDVAGIIVAVRMKSPEKLDVVAFGGFMDNIKQAIVMILCKLSETLDAVYKKGGLLDEREARSSFQTLMTDLLRKL